MKLTIFGVLGLFASAMADSAQQVLQNDPVGTADAPDKPNLDFTIAYGVDDEPEDLGFYGLFNEKEVELKYAFTNKQEEPIKIVGCGGAFRDADTTLPVVNLTDAAIGPIDVGSGETVNFIQKVGVSVVPTTYLLAPIVYISYDDVLYVINAKQSVVKVDDIPVSLLDPQFLVALGTLLATTFVGGYYIVTKFAIPYVNKNYLKKNAPVKPVSAKKVAATSNIGKKEYDESWLPKGHLKKKKN